MHTCTHMQKVASYATFKGGGISGTISALLPVDIFLGRMDIYFWTEQTTKMPKYASMLNALAYSAQNSVSRTQDRSSLTCAKLIQLLC